MTTTNRVQKQAKQVKILVIEDNTDHWVLMRKALQECIPEANPVHVTNSEQALDLLNEWNTQEWELPKLIFQDLYLPAREDGWHLLQQIKTMAPACSRIPIVMLSSSNDRTDVIESYQHGVASYLVKPANFMEWLTYFNELRTYWWDTVTLPTVQFSV